MTIFDTYDDQQDTYTVSPSLLWDCDLATFDYQASRHLVATRVAERGHLEDFFAAFRLYGGKEGFREILKEVPYLSKKDINFVCNIFDLKKEELRCYTRSLSRQARLHS